jgi:redox-sensitive bicupin YhaK (pirin superfamily)
MVLDHCFMKTPLVVLPLRSLISFHAEFNASPSDEAHLLQIWIIPDKLRIAPRYEQKSFAKEILSGAETLIASPDARASSIKIEQDVLLSAKRTKSGEKILKALDRERIYWLQLVNGELEVSGSEHSSTLRLGVGDALGIANESSLTLTSLSESEFLFFDLPPNF